MPGAELRADFWITEFLTPWDVYHHGVTTVHAHERTPYQEMFIVSTGSYGKGLVLDGKWQSCTGDEFLYHEALVHPGMILHGRPRNALILGGGEGAALREALRWKTVERVTMVDLDRQVVEACREHLPEIHQGAFEDPRLEMIYGDAIAYLDESNEAWDVIYYDLTDPIEHGPSYPLFTREYFARARRRLAPDGVFVAQAGPISPHELPHHARLLKTLGTVFQSAHSYASYVPTYGAPWGFALCADRPLETRPDPETIDRLLAERTTGGLRFLDGTTLLGLLQTALHVRRAIERETVIYTLDNPPKFFGGGVAV